jgi:hypothetical protein
VTIIVLILTGFAALLGGTGSRRQAVVALPGAAGRTPGYGVAAAGTRYTARV